MQPHRVTIDNWPQILACLGLGFVICWGLIALILRRAERGLSLERAKDYHHGHKAPIPRLGGVGLACAFLAVAVAVELCTDVPAAGQGILCVIVLSSLAMFTLGFVDDVRPLGAKFKLIAQIGIASAAYICNVRIELFHDPFSGTDLQLGALGYLATVLWLVSLTNLINLIDGIDGLAGGIGLMLMLLMANFGATDHLDFCTLLAIGVAGALIGFLKFNYPPARIYMGDGGAYFLGFLIGILSIVNSNKGTVAAALIAPAFALALPIVDVSLAILRRGARGLPVFRPDQKHIHHHLITLGISRERTLLNLYTVSLLCLFLALCVFCLQGRMLGLYTGLLVLVLIVAGHLSGFTRNWFEVGSQLGQSLRLRKETRYALTLDRWFMMESERREGLEELLEDYKFIVRKLGFARLKLTLPNGATHIWQADDFDATSAGNLQAEHEISDGTVVALTAAPQKMNEALFTLLGDLAAEMWYKAEQRFRVASPATQAAPATGSRPGDSLISQSIL